MNERGQAMRVTDNLLNDEGKRIAKRGGRRYLLSADRYCSVVYRPTLVPEDRSATQLDAD